jgi:hypothetical protein
VGQADGRQPGWRGHQGPNATGGRKIKNEARGGVVDKGRDKGQIGQGSSQGDSLRAAGAGTVRHGRPTHANLPNQARTDTKEEGEAATAASSS